MSSRDHARADFEDFVVVCSSRLLRTAYLLTGDLPSAEALLRSALARTWLSWERLDEQPEPHVLRVLVGEYLGRGGSGAAGRAAGAPGDELSAALAPLTRGQRAVVVLRHADGLTVEETADALGCSAATVRNREARVLSTGLQPAWLARDEDGAVDDDPSQLSAASIRERLPAVDRRSRVLRRRRTFRRALTGIVAGAAVCAALLVLPSLGPGAAPAPAPVPDAEEHPDMPDMVGFPLPYRLDVNDVPYEYHGSQESPDGQALLRVAVGPQDQPQALAWATPASQPGQVVVRVDGGLASRSPAGSFQTGLLLSARRAHLVVVRVTEPTTRTRIGLAIYHWPQPVLDSLPAHRRTGS